MSEGLHASNNTLLSMFILPLFNFFQLQTPRVQKLDSTPPTPNTYNSDTQIPHLQMLKKRNITENTSKVVTLVNLKHSTSHRYAHSCIQIGRKKS